MSSIRPIEARDWQLARRLRLSALRDAPDAFSATAEEEQSFPDARWRARAADNAQREQTAGFFAVRDDAECGIAVGVFVGGEPVTVELASLWVHPQARGQGHGAALVGAVADWARSRGAQRLRLEVTKTSHAARALYERLGFRADDDVNVTCGARQARAVRMSLDLADGPRHCSDDSDHAT